MSGVTPVADAQGTGEQLLAVSDLTKGFGGVKAVSGVSFSVQRGRITGLIGPNGSGKSTTFNLISGFLKPDAGQIYFGDERIDGKRPSVLARAGIGRTFQLVETFGRMNVLDNVLLAIRSGRPSLLRSGERMAAMDALEMVGLNHLAHAKAGELSYGQQKLLDLATVLVTEPDLLLMDEPVAGITGSTINRIREVLVTLREERDTTILLIEHNLPLAMDLCDWMHVLDRGRLLASGLPLDVRNNDAVIRAYLGGGDTDTAEVDQ